MSSAAPLTAVFEQILRNSLWASALGILLALVWRWLPGRMRHGFGLLVLCRLLLPAAPVSPLSAANWWRGFPASALSTGGARAGGTAAGAHFPPGSQSPADAMTSRAAGPAERASADETGRLAPSARLPGQPATPSAAAGAGNSAGAGFHWTMTHSAAVWLAGAVLLAARLGGRQRAFNRWWKARRIPAAGLWRDSLTECLTLSARKLSGDGHGLNGAAGGSIIGAGAGAGGRAGTGSEAGNGSGGRVPSPRRFRLKPGRKTFRRRVQIWQVPGLGSPLAVGIFQPCILVPSGLDGLLNAAERAHILQHELAHHRHHDLIWNLLLTAARVLHWFNPLVHPAASRLLREREIQRDADAILACVRAGAGAGTSPLPKTTAGAADAVKAAGAGLAVTAASAALDSASASRAAAAAAAAGYGATLLKLATLLAPLRSGTPVPQPSGSALLGKHHLKQRLTMIPQHTRTTTSRPAARITFTAAALALAALTFTRAEDKATASPSVPPPATAPSEPEQPEPVSWSRTQSITFKLNNIVLPRMQFTGAHMGEIITYLKWKSIQDDKLTLEPDQKGIDIVQKGESTTPITCDLRNVKLIDAIKTVCELSGFLYRIETNSVFVIRKDLEDRSLVTRVFRINDTAARAMGWKAGDTTPLPQLLTSRYGIEFPEGAAASLNLETERLVARLPLRELDNLETVIELSFRNSPVAVFSVEADGIRASEEDSSKILTESEFAAFLKTTAAKSPQTVIRLQCAAEVPYDQVTATLGKVRAAGLKNVDLAIRAESRETPPAVAPLYPAK